MKGSPCFLVVEDDRAVGQTVSRKLSAYGLTRIATSYERGRELLDQGGFTALITDVKLPDGSGLDLAATARSRWPLLPVLVVSGAVDQGRLREAHALGAHYLLKPVEASQLDLFARRAIGAVGEQERRISAVVEEWQRQYDLTDAEAEVLRLSALGAQRSELPKLRSVATGTIKKQARLIIDKTGQATFEAAVAAVLREAIAPA